MWWLGCIFCENNSREAGLLTFGTNGDLLVLKLNYMNAFDQKQLGNCAV